LATAFAVMIGRAALADVILPAGLPPGSKYQIAFLTAETTSGTSGLESTYNDFVTQEASKDVTLNALGASWHAITSTHAGATYTSAAINAPTYSGVPIYNTHGLLVSVGNAIWDTANTPLISPINYTQFGLLAHVNTGLGNGFPYTGNLPAGYAYDGHALGDSRVWIGDPTQASYTWTSSSATFDPSVPRPLYALSSPITVSVPEPCTLALLASALLGLAVGCLRRHRSQP